MWLSTVCGGGSVRVRPSGWVQVTVVLWCRVGHQPSRRFARWWWRHNRMPLSTAVGPCSSTGTTWSMSHHAGGRSQPSNRQPRSRSVMALRIAGGHTLVAVPTSSGRLPPSTMMRVTVQSSNSRSRVARPIGPAQSTVGGDTDPPRPPRTPGRRWWSGWSGSDTRSARLARTIRCGRDPATSGAPGAASAALPTARSASARRWSMLRRSSGGVSGGSWVMNALIAVANVAPASASNTPDRWNAPSNVALNVSRRLA